MGPHLIDEPFRVFQPMGFTFIRPMKSTTVLESKVEKNGSLQDGKTLCRRGSYLAVGRFPGLEDFTRRALPKVHEQHVVFFAIIGRPNVGFRCILQHGADDGVVGISDIRIDIILSSFHIDGHKGHKLQVTLRFVRVSEVFNGSSLLLTEASRRGMESDHQKKSIEGPQSEMLKERGA
jgi:hypothetical protein